MSAASAGCPSPAQHQVAESFRSFANGLSRFSNLPRGIPQNIELKVRRLPVEHLFKRSGAVLHHLLRGFQGILRFLPIRIGGGVLSPHFRFHLVAGNFAGRSNRAVTVARLNLRQRGPPVHGVQTQAKPKDEQQHGHEPS